MKKIVHLTLIVILTACSLGAKNELEKNHQTWKDSGITHYRFSLSIGCFCPFGDQMPLTVEVQNDKIISITCPDGKLVAETDPNYETFARHATIERIFSELETGLSTADEVKVTYDSAKGFPKEIYFDYIKAAMDDELSIGVSNLEVLK